ncbi:unnamed protein product [Cuscuta europaea]|uniref:Uncharacterized protein n=1 Tax=Cuscuta europaea TaxID=41803 RepID=A0A9P0Z340_CUSEU|nr:unnamed protein product [Cuscuta europaea]
MSGRVNQLQWRRFRPVAQLQLLPFVDVKTHSGEPSLSLSFCLSGRSLWVLFRRQERQQPNGGMATSEAPAYSFSGVGKQVRQYSVRCFLALQTIIINDSGFVGLLSSQRRLWLCF